MKEDVKFLYLKAPSQKPFLSIMQAEEPHGPICEIARQHKSKDFSRPENLPATNIRKGVENIFLALITYIRSSIHSECLFMHVPVWLCSSVNVKVFCIWRNDLNFRHFSLDALGAVLKICNLEEEKWKSACNAIYCSNPQLVQTNYPESKPSCNFWAIMMTFLKWWR